MKSQTATREVFYSRSAGLIFYPEPTKQVMHEGQMQVIDGIVIRFSPVGGGFGQFIAESPEEIEYCRQRMKVVGDVMDAKTFMEMTTPQEVKIERAERMIQTQNRIISDMQAEIAKLKGGTPSATK